MSSINFHWISKLDLQIFSRLEVSSSISQIPPCRTVIVVQLAGFMEGDVLNIAFFLPISLRQTEKDLNPLTGSMV